MKLYDYVKKEFVYDLIERIERNDVKGFLKYFCDCCTITLKKVDPNKDPDDNGNVDVQFSGYYTIKTKIYPEVYNCLEKYITFEKKVSTGYRYVIDLSRLFGNLYRPDLGKEKDIAIVVSINIADLDSGRNTSVYNEWKKNVLIRDEYTCRCCGSKNNLEVHHIKPYKNNKSLRTDIHNGITLCEMCHSGMVYGGFHQVYGMRNNTQEQLQEYFNNKRDKLKLPLINIDDILYPNGDKPNIPISIIGETDNTKLTDEFEQLQQEKIKMQKEVIFNTSSPFLKLYGFNQKDQKNILSKGELDVFLKLCDYVSYGDCVLRNNGKPSGKPLLIKDMCRLVNGGEETIRRTITALKKKKAIGRHNIGEVFNAEPWYTLNPYIVSRGNKVQQWVLDYYKGSGWNE